MAHSVNNNLFRPLFLYLTENVPFKIHVIVYLSNLKQTVILQWLCSCQFGNEQQQQQCRGSSYLRFAQYSYKSNFCNIEYIFFRFRGIIDLSKSHPIKHEKLYSFEPSMQVRRHVRFLSMKLFCWRYIQCSLMSFPMFLFVGFSF